MTKLYTMLETNTDETLNKKQSTKKFDILFDLESEKHIIYDPTYSKNIICVCGSCDLLLEKNGENDSITLNDHKVTIHLDKDVKAELKNYTKETRVFVQYLEESNE